MLHPLSNPALFYRDHVLTACVGDQQESERALEPCAGLSLEEIDPASRRLLPLLYRRWGTTNRGPLIELARAAYLTTWRQNHERMIHVAQVLDALKATGVECMLLKGAAITLRHYRDYGARSMGDFDLLIQEDQIERAVRVLLADGWTAECGCTAETIRRQSRVRHAWQFSKGDTLNCDLHWRPLARCYSPMIAELFWSAAETVHLGSQKVRLPCPTDQFFHVCVHAMHWEWTPNLYWVADALTVLGDGEVDWGRAEALAIHAGMRVRFAAALSRLTLQFHADIPKHVCAVRALRWEQREYALLQKPCPLGYLDSVAWHVYHFRRLRGFDAQWRSIPAFIGFPRYVAAFLDALSWRELLAKLWVQLKLRARSRYWKVRSS